VSNRLLLVFGISAFRFWGVTQCSLQRNQFLIFGGALCDIPRNGCEGNYIDRLLILAKAVDSALIFLRRILKLRGNLTFIFLKSRELFGIQDSQTALASKIIIIIMMIMKWIMIMHDDDEDEDDNNDEDETCISSRCEMTCFCCITSTTIYSVHEHGFEST